MAKFILMTQEDGQSVKPGGESCDYEDFPTLDDALARAREMAPGIPGEEIEVYMRVRIVTADVGPVRVNEG